MPVGTCIPSGSTCGPPPSACQSLAAQIRADAETNAELQDYQGKDRTQTPCAAPTPPRYVPACEKLREKCGGGCQGLC
ncbi:MAG: hypothetical protein R3B13_03135 [Polyangiaceae bacterium]